MSAAPEAVLIGYFPKRRTPRPDWLDAPGVHTVCSVAECIAPGPDGWLQARRHNEWGYYRDPATAWSVVPDGERANFDLRAYELVPVRYVEGAPVPFAVGADGVRALDGTFRALGYDVVSRGESDFFECSPLSCNAWATDVGANRHCLVDDLDAALRLASIAEASRCEPGDYHVMRVWSRSPDGGRAADGPEPGGEDASGAAR